MNHTSDLEASDTNKPLQLPLPPPAPPPPLICIHESIRTSHMNEYSPTIFSLTHAIEEDSVERMVSLIEDKGVDINFKLSFGISILLKAVRSRATKIVDYLISKGADTESAVRDIMKRFHGLEVEYDTCRRYDQWSVDMVKKMLPLLGNRLHDIVDNEGRTLLHLSCYFPDLSIFEYLLKAGLDPNITDKQGSSVLSLLVTHHDSKGAFEMMQQVLSQPNVQVDVRNHFGSTPLFQSFLVNKLDFFYLLLEKGADPFLQTYSGNTLMHCPFLHSHKYIILHDLGLNANTVNKAGQRPLQNKDVLGFDFFILIILGRQVMEPEYKKMETSFDTKTINSIRERVNKGKFSAHHLQAICRRTIRNVLFKRYRQSLTERIWQLPLPKPLLLYLDIYLYAQHLLDLFDS